MKKKLTCIFVVGTMMAMLSACNNNNTEMTELQTSTSESETYGVNMTSTENSTTQNSTEQNSAGSDYEINDMLPRPSDDTFIMTVEEAEAFMKNRNNVISDLDGETSE